MMRIKPNYLYFIGMLLLALCLPINADELPRGLITLDNNPAENFTISDYDGKRYELKQSRGKWVFVHFWASWCGPCRKEMPHIQSLVQTMSGKKMAFMIINTAESEDTVFSFIGGVAPELHSLLDRDGMVTEAWQPRGLPAPVCSRTRPTCETSPIMPETST